MSDLLKAARAMEDPKMKWRVSAAQFIHAKTIAVDGTKSPQERTFAAWALQNPGVVDPSLLAFVVSDPTVIGGVTLDGPEGDVPETDGVTDEQIRAVVADRWLLVAKKF